MRALLTILAFGLLACTGPTGPAGRDGIDGIDGEPFPPPHVFGTYDLVSVNGNPLPYVFAQGPSSRTQFVAGSISLNTNGTFVRSTTNQTITTANDTTTDVVTMTGTFTNTEGQLAFTGPIAMSAIVFRNTLTLNPVGSETYVYRR